MSAVGHGKEKKADHTGQNIRKEGRSSTKETESKMFAFLPDVDLDIESSCARKSRKSERKSHHCCQE